MGWLWVSYFRYGFMMMVSAFYMILLAIFNNFQLFMLGEFGCSTGRFHFHPWKLNFATTVMQKILVGWVIIRGWSNYIQLYQGTIACVLLTVYPWYFAGVLGWDSWAFICHKYPRNTGRACIGISHRGLRWDRGTSNYSPWYIGINSQEAIIMRIPSWSNQDSMDGWMDGMPPFHGSDSIHRSCSRHWLSLRGDL